MRTKQVLGIATAALLAMGLAGCAGSAGAGQQTSALPAKDEVAALFTEWNAALGTGSPAAVADKYAADAVLLPTVSNEVRTDRAAIIRYFETFLAKKPSGEILTRSVNVLDADSATDNGTYRFRFGDGTTVDARYSYVYERRDGRWLIVSHHSSAMPEQPAA